MDEKTAKELALVITVNCVRNTCIESYHAAGKLDDRDMKAFNREVVNRTYTFPDRLFNASGDEHKAFLEEMHFISAGSAHSWDEPELDQNLWKADKWKATGRADCRLPRENFRSDSSGRSSRS